MWLNRCLVLAETDKETDANGFHREIGRKDEDFADLIKEIRSSIADYQKAVKQHRYWDQSFIFFAYTYMRRSGV